MHVRHAALRLHGEWFRGDPIEEEIHLLVRRWGTPDISKWIDWSQSAIRMNQVMKTRIRKYQGYLQKTTGLDVSFPSAVRSLIKIGLDAHDR